MAAAIVVLYTPPTGRPSVVEALVPSSRWQLCQRCLGIVADLWQNCLQRQSCGVGNDPPDRWLLRLGPWTPWAIAASFFFVLTFLGQEKIGSASTLSGFPPENCPPQSIQTMLQS
jgi:hypothetical protein